MKNKLDQNLQPNSNEIWNAISDFGANKKLDYKKFSENLGERGIKVSPILAKQLFDQIAGPDGTISQQQMEELLKKLDAMQLPPNFAGITMADLGDLTNCMTIMKRVLLAAGAGDPFDVDDFIVNTKINIDMGTINFLGKLSDRDIPWDQRVAAMETISANIADNGKFADIFSAANIPELLCGWAAQVLDNKPEVQKTAIDLLPNIYHEVLTQGDQGLAVGQLEEILDNLFKVLDDPNSSKNHPATKDAIDRIVDDIVNIRNPEAILFLAGLLSEKCDIENCTSAQARSFALQQLQKIMFSSESPYLTFDTAKAPEVDEALLPKKGTANREWLDIATGKQDGPITDEADSSQPKNADRNQARDVDINDHLLGGNVNEDDYNDTDSPDRNWGGAMSRPNNQNSLEDDIDPNRRRRGRKRDLSHCNNYRRLCLVVNRRI
jgi:hypothetical protein